MRFGYYLNHRCFCRNHYSEYSLFRALTRMLIRKFFCEHPRPHNIMMLELVDSPKKCCHWQCRFSIPGSVTLDMCLLKYTSSTLYIHLTAIYLDMDLLTSNYTLLVSLAASSLMDDFEMYILGRIFSGCIGCIAVDWLVSAFLQCSNGWRIWHRACQLALSQSALPWPRVVYPWFAAVKLKRKLMTNRFGKFWGLYS